MPSAFITGDNKLSTRWKGYDGCPTPSDVTLSDVHQLSLEEAWKKYALRGRLHDAKAPIGVHLCLRGHLWNLGSDGLTTVVGGGRVFTAPAGDGASITEMELGRHW